MKLNKPHTQLCSQTWKLTLQKCSTRMEFHQAIGQASDKKYSFLNIYVKLSETCISQGLGKLRKRANSRSKGKQATKKKSYVKHLTMFFFCCALWTPCIQNLNSLLSDPYALILMYKTST